MCCRPRAGRSPAEKIPESEYADFEICALYVRYNYGVIWEQDGSLSQSSSAVSGLSFMVQLECGRMPASSVQRRMSSKDDSPEFSSVRVSGATLDLLHIMHSELWEDDPKRHSLNESIRELMQRERLRQREGESEGEQ